MAEQADGQEVAYYQPAVTVKAGETANCDFQMKPGLMVQGRVTDEATGNPLPGMEVGAAHVSDAEVAPPYRATTDADGRYRLRIPGGGLRLAVRDTVKATVSTDHRDEQRRAILGETADLPETTIDFAIQTMPKLTLEGTVYGPDGKPLSDGVVEYSSGEMTGRVSVSSGGTFFASPSANSLTFPVYLLTHSGNLSAAMVIERGSSDPIQLRLTARPRPTITGSVVDVDGNPVAGARILVHKAPLKVTKRPEYIVREVMPISYPSEQITTDARGKFTWVGWPDFSYRFTVNSGAVSKTVPATTKTPLMPESGKETPLRIVMPKTTGVLRGTVVDEEGQPLTGAILQFQGDDVTMKTTTDERGRFRASGLVEGRTLRGDIGHLTKGLWYGLSVRVGPSEVRFILKKSTKYYLPGNGRTAASQ